MKKVVLYFSLIFSLFFIVGCSKKEEANNVVEAKKPKEKVDIIDINSKSRPYAVVINNFPSAVKVQAGLNKAYMIYEIPIEGNISRSVALFKDVDDVKIGTLRSARHNYLDYVEENDAIFVHFGWSHKAEEDIYKYKIENIDGNYADPKPFWRENPENLASEHTAYTNLKNIIEYNNDVKKYRTTTEEKPLLNYNVKDVYLSKYNDSIDAKNVEIKYSGAYIVKFVYDEKTKRYDRFVNDVEHVDYFTKEKFDTKNIIVTLIDYGYVKEYRDAAGNNYLDLYNTGTGKGYYITNGKAIEITWKKDDRFSKTKYLYNDKEIEVSDGNTYIMIQSNSQGVTIN